MFDPRTPETPNERKYTLSKRCIYSPKGTDPAIVQLNLMRYNKIGQMVIQHGTNGMSEVENNHGTAPNNSKNVRLCRISQ